MAGTEWISVEDRLPDFSGKVLYWMTPDEVTGGWGVATYFYGVGTWGTGGGDRITHWMPLPEPPDA